MQMRRRRMSRCAGGGRADASAADELICRRQTSRSAAGGPTTTTDAQVIGRSQAGGWESSRAAKSRDLAGGAVPVHEEILSFQIFLFF
jgi:hypothetical protein